MKTDKWYRLAGAFLWQYKAELLVFFTETLVFLFVFDLYQLEMEPLLYGAGLCVIGHLLLMICRFCLFCRKHRKLRHTQEAILYLWNTLPSPDTLPESDYQEMIRVMGNRLGELSTAWQTERQESLDYYTTWVHQIKTPISAMQMMLQSEDSEEHRELSAELFRIEQYVEMVLSYIRLGSSSHDFVFQEYDLDPLIRQAIRKYAPQFIRRRIRLVYEPVQMTVLTDEKWLLFIVEQLLSNAVKYTPSHGTVTVSVTPDEKLTVSDTGIGIAPEDLPRIFEKGFTGYNGRTDKRSTGLGLYLCRQAADRLSIPLTAVSTPGVGSAFTLDLHKKKLELY